MFLMHEINKKYIFIVTHGMCLHIRPQMTWIECDCHKSYPKLWKTMAFL
jgi:hypothetical protein